MSATVLRFPGEYQALVGLGASASAGQGSIDAGSQW